MPTLERRPTHKAIPLLRSEVSRITHRRLFRVFAVLFLLGIVAISTIVFFAHHKNPATMDSATLDRQIDRMHRDWERCMEQVPAGEPSVDFCGEEPTGETVDAYDFQSDSRYKGYENIPVALIATAMGAAGVAFIVGASSGGAEWSSRSMTLQLLYEPRRLRLLAIKWLGLLIAVVSLAALAMLVAVGIAALTTSARGTWDQRHALVPELQDHLWSTMALMGLRGLLLTAVAATVGYAIAMLVRNTGGSLGVAFVYFAVFENGVRIALFKYGIEPFMLSTNSIASLFPGGVEVPGAEQPSGDPEMVDLTNLRAIGTMLTYCVLLCLPAVWSFTRRDVS